MTNVHRVHAVTVVVANLVAALFVHLYGLLQANWLQHAHKLDLRVLPLPTAFYHHYALAGYLLPVAAALLLGLRDRGQGDRAGAREVGTAIVTVATIAWLLGCVLAWQLPLYNPVVRVE